MKEHPEVEGEDTRPVATPVRGSEEILSTPKASSEISGVAPEGDDSDVEIVQSLHRPRTWSRHLPDDVNQWPDAQLRSPWPLSPDTQLDPPTPAIKVEESGETSEMKD